jgi:hypothetical protein
VLERPVALDQPELALAGFELQLQPADEDRAGAVEHARTLAEEALDRRHEVRRHVGEHLHRRRSGT